MDETKDRIIETLKRFAQEGADQVSLSALLDDSDTETIGEALRSL